MERAAARLPKDSNHERYPCGGLIAPLSAVRTLGSDAAFYARFVQEGVCFSLAILILLFPIILINMGLGAERDYNLLLLFIILKMALGDACLHR